MPVERILHIQEHVPKVADDQISEMSIHLEQFFKLCDPGEAKSVDREAFRRLCSQFDITGHDADVIFEDLDQDHDGRISFEDFSRGFSDFLMSSGCSDPDSHSVEAEESERSKTHKSDETIKQNVWSAITVEAEKVCKKSSNEGKLKWLVDELQSSEKRHLVPYLESAVEELLSNLQHLQEEKLQLEESWKREKQEHDRHLKRMEEEMDNQVKEAELKLRLKAQADVEDERKSLQTKMDAEMDNLQVHLDLFEKVNSWLQNHPQENCDRRLDEVKMKLDDAFHENRQLRLSLLDTQTNIALMRSELLQLRTLYEEKCKELNSEREKVLEVLHEQDQLSRQLNLLHDVNKRLQDTNDALRSSLDHPNFLPRRTPESNLLRGKSGSVIGDYFDAAYSPVPICSFPENEDIGDEEDATKFYKNHTSLRRARSMDVTYFPTQKLSRSTDRRPVRRHLIKSDARVTTDDEYQEHDEGFSSTPDSSLPVKEEEERQKQEQFLEVCPSTHPKRPLSLTTESDSNLSDELQEFSSYGIKSERQELRTLKPSSSVGTLLQADEMPKKRISEIIKQLGFQEATRRRRSRLLKSSNSEKVSQQSQDDSSKKIQNTYDSQNSIEERNCVPEFQTDKDDFPVENNSCIDQKREGKHAAIKQKHGAVQNGCYAEEAFLTSLDEDMEYEPDGLADTTFNVIFVGDAGVGKSSFALRISKGVFMKHTNSTLGVDFLMRTIRVDGRNIAVQLWDTAGQEKFRSITKSYFRRADGVMLLYDCTCEESFLNVRQWAADVDSILSQRIPLMIIGNKTDLREVFMKSGTRCISTEEGRKLAEECDATFIEASAKDGSNVLHALANLVRSMSSHQELRASASIMQLCDKKQKKKGCCGR